MASGSQNANLNTMRNSKSKVPPELPQEEWDFSACPDEQLPFCLQYEYTRQLAREYFKVMGKPYEKELFTSCFASYYKEGKGDATKTEFLRTFTDDPDRGLLQRKALCAQKLCDLPEFPDIPFLRSPLDLNSRNTVASWISERQRSGLLDTDPVVVRFFWWHYLALSFAGAMKVEETDLGRDALRRLSDSLVGIDVCLLRIDWSHSNNEIVKSFATWVGKVRKNAPPNMNVKESRGRTLPREQLKFLSAYRLLAVMSASDAADFTQEHLGDPLYSEDGDWYKARKKAQLTMKRFFDPFFRFDEQGQVQPHPSSSVIDDPE